MEAVDPFKRACFYNSIHAAANNIAEGLSDRQSAAADGNWTKWDELRQDMSLNPVLILYRYLVHILNTFASQYRTKSLTHSGRQVQSCTVEDTIRLILQALTAFGNPDTRLIS